MLKNISSFFTKSNPKQLQKINMLFRRSSLRYFCTDIEKFDPEKKPKLIIPIRINEPLMPFGNSIRFFGKDDPILVDILKRYKEDYEKADKFAAFLYDKRKRKMVNTGVQCNILNLEATGEITLISKPGDLRMQLINDENIKFEGEYAEAVEIKDKESANKLIEYEFARNIVADINKVILNCLSIVSKPMSPMESSLLRDLNSVLIYLQGLLQSNTDFI